METLFTNHKHSFHRQNWLLIAPDNIPRQSDSCSCGIFACINAYILIPSKSPSPIYSSKDINRIRYWMVDFLVKTPLVNRKRKAVWKEMPHSVKFIDIKRSEISRNIPCTVNNRFPNEKSAFQRLKTLAICNRSTNTDFRLACDVNKSTADDEQNLPTCSKTLNPMLPKYQNAGKKDNC